MLLSNTCWFDDGLVLGVLAVEAGKVVGEGALGAGGVACTAFLVIGENLPPKKASFGAAGSSILGNGTLGVG